MTWVTGHLSISGESPIPATLTICNMSEIQVQVPGSINPSPGAVCEFAQESGDAYRFVIDLAITQQGVDSFVTAINGTRIG